MDWREDKWGFGIYTDSYHKSLKPHFINNNSYNLLIIYHILDSGVQKQNLPLRLCLYNVNTLNEIAKKFLIFDLCLIILLDLLSTQFHITICNYVIWRTIDQLWSAFLSSLLYTKDHIHYLACFQNHVKWLRQGGGCEWSITEDMQSLAEIIKYFPSWYVLN